MSKKQQLASDSQQTQPARRGRPRQSKNSKADRQESQATELVVLADSAGLELFHSPGADPDGFTSIPVDGHRETWRIGTKSFRYWLQRLYWNAHKSAANAQAVQDGIGVLRGKAFFDGPEISVFVRLAEFDGVIWLDIGNTDWQAVRIDGDGWDVVNAPPVRFVRPRGMLPLPIPERGGNVDDLRPFLNVGSDADWLLAVSWMIAALRPAGPYPVLGLHGEQGSAKSTACRMLRSLVDPNDADLRSQPRNEQDLVIAASNGWIVALENLSKIPDWFSDALCRLSTGGGFGTRELYTDDEEKLFNAKRPVMLNGISELATRPDLLDRSILVTLPRIPDDARRTETELWQEFDAAKPRILGALLDAVSTALANIDGVVLPCKPRMADFAEWGCAAEPALNCVPGAFLAAYMGNRATANEAAIESSIIAEPLLALLRGRDDWDGTATELKGHLEDAADSRTIKQHNWPKRPHVLSGELRRIAPNLRRMGIDVEFGRSGGRRFIRLARTTAQDSVQSVTHRENGRSGASPERHGTPSAAAENPGENGPLGADDANDAHLRDCSEDDYAWVDDLIPPA
ncbi:MAG: hypothetical protein ACE5KM_13960 [Planctomycetaceae bacterium]